MIAVVEAKPEYKKPGDGLQQAKDYAQILGLKFAYSTNGHGIVEHDFLTGKDNDIENFPAPDELWRRIKQSENIPDEIKERLLAPYYHLSGKSPRYYQEMPIKVAASGYGDGAAHMETAAFVAYGLDSGGPCRSRIYDSYPSFGPPTNLACR